MTQLEFDPMRWAWTHRPDTICTETQKQQTEMESNSSFAIRDQIFSKQKQKYRKSSARDGPIFGSRSSLALYLQNVLIDDAGELVWAHTALTYMQIHSYK